MEASSTQYTTFSEAVAKAEEMGDSCYGVTAVFRKKKVKYMLRKTRQVVKSKPSQLMGGFISWTKGQPAEILLKYKRL